MIMGRSPQMIGYYPRTTETFAHYLLTRFNVDIWYSRWLKQREISIDGWHEHRIDLFARYCVPSVRAQTSQEFEWLIACDPKTPRPILRKIAQLAGPRARLILICGPEGNWHSPQRQQMMAKYMRRNAHNAAHILMTMLDNDDALHQEYMEQVQQVIPEKGPAVLSFPNYYIHLPQSGMTRRCIYLANPYVTAIERNDRRLKTCWIASHGTLPRHFLFVEMPNKKEMMLQILHEHNLVNTLIGQIIDTPASFEHFGQKKEAAV